MHEAVGRTLDTIAPANPNPSTLGPRASDAATDIIRGVERQRTAAVDPVYARANADTVPADAVNATIAQIDNISRGDRTGILSGRSPSCATVSSRHPRSPVVPPYGSRFTARTARLSGTR